jgi:hypothetical protein
MSHPRRPARPGRALTVYLVLLGPLLGGYLAFDKAFAYLHVPGTPVYVGEAVLLVGIVGVATGTGYLAARLATEPALLLLAAFTCWGLVRTLPYLPRYGLDAVRDAALWYYALAAFAVIAALSRSPDGLDRLLGGLTRFVPWLLAWLPFGVVLSSVEDGSPTVPWSAVSVLNHKPGNAVVAALLALGVLWLLPGRRGDAARAWWTAVAVVVVMLVVTQNRGGLLAAVAGTAAGLALVSPRARRRALHLATVAVLLVVTALAVVPLPVGGAQGRDFSASQLIRNVLSLGGSDVPGNLNGTTRGRIVLWSRVLDRQVATGRLVDGSGFGPNLAAEVGVYDEGTTALRSPHNSHLDILARMGLLGLALWIAVWACWYRQVVGGCRRLAREGLHAHRRLSVVCLMVVTAILVSCVFDPQLEGAQVAVLLWTAFGTGAVVTSRRALSRAVPVLPVRAGGARPAVRDAWPGSSAGSGR